jgi:hypothetical protein
MQRPAHQTLSRILLAAALGSGCSGPGEAAGPVKGPVHAASAAPSATALAAPSGSATQAPPPAPEEPLGPLSAELSAALGSIAADPAPPKITLNTHYVVSNEDKPYVFHDAVAGRGGVYIGVGAEQSFLFAGWARAELLLLMDFDDWVVDINEVHGIVFEHARSPDEVIELWGPDRSGDVKAWIEERAPERATAEKRKKVYDQGRLQVHRRLKWLKSTLAGVQRPFFASDQAELDHVARLWKSKRVRCVRGDLTATGALRAFGDLARRAGWVVRMLYLSNAELYFPYDQGGFRDNVRGLPFDERSIVLHTQPIDSAEYHYVWQDAKTYAGWIGRVRTFVDLLHEAKLPQLGKLQNGAWWIKPP